MNEHEPSLLDLLSAQHAVPAARRLPEAETRRRLQLRRLELQNIFCYRQAELELEDGITVIAGPNGSGKSSLLEAIFFALYGSRAGPAMGRNLAEVLREGTRRGYVELDFIYEDRKYSVQVELRRQGERVLSERDGCWLRRDDGTEWQGAESVVNQVQELLHMDRDDFTNCVYVRQGEIDRLIRAGDEERRGMIDRLLRLERLENYATRAKEGARRAINRRLDILSSRLSELQAELNSLKEEGLAKRQKAIERELARQQEALDEIEAEINRWEEAQATARERLRQALELEQELKDLERQRAEKHDRLTERERQADELRAELLTLAEQVDRLETQIEAELQEHDLPRETIQVSPAAREFAEFTELAALYGEAQERVQGIENQLQTERERAILLQEKIDQLERALKEQEGQLAEHRRELEAEREREKGLKERIVRLRTELAAREREAYAMLKRISGVLEALGTSPQLSELREDEVARLQEELAQQKTELERKHTGLQEKLLQVQAQRAQLQEGLEHAEELIKEGRCPTCGQPVSATTLADHLEHLRTELQELDKRIPPLQEELARLSREEQKIEQAEGYLRELARLLDRLNLERAQLAEREEEHARLSERLTMLRNKLAQIEKKRKEQEKELAATRANHQERQEHLEELQQAVEKARAQLARLERVKNLIERWLRLREGVRQREKTHQALLATLGELRTDLENLDRRVQKLRAARRDPVKLQEQLQALQEKLGELQDKRQGLQKRLQELLNYHGIILNKREQEEKLKQEVERVAAQLEKTKQLRVEIEQLSELYRAVKKELRQQNIAALNQYFNRFFRLMDSGESYNRAIITDDYAIQIELKDGQRIEPTLMSGGERALINIALRCAIHEVLARAVRALPLILDEPTIYLDRERIQRLQFLLEELGQRVGQVIVVSHEENLLESADHEYRTHKERDNTSTVRRIR